MPLRLMVIFIILAVIIAVLTSVLIIKDKLPIKYAVLWYFFALILLFVGILPDFVAMVASFFGFATLSNFLSGLVIVLLVLLSLALTVMIASQRRRIGLVSQEVALLRKELQDALGKLRRK